MRSVFAVAVFVGAMVVHAAGARAEENPTKPTSLHDFTVKDIDGKSVDLSKYKGKVVLLVNVASKCGNTPQYAQLEELFQKYGPQGLVVAGFPANDFGSQEPGTNEQIKEFCQSTYQVKFDMYAKIATKGADQAPLYKWLTDPATSKFGGPITWNFAKFVIGKDGKIAGRFDPRTKPDDAEIVKLIEAELAK
jgi:glutathione peroxidase